MLFLAVVSNRHKDDGLIVSQGRFVKFQRFSLKCSTTLQHPQHTRPNAMSSAIKIKQSGSFPPTEHIHSGQVEPCLFELRQCCLDT